MCQGSGLSDLFRESEGSLNGHSGYRSVDRSKRDPRSARVCIDRTFVLNLPRLKRRTQKPRASRREPYCRLLVRPTARRQTTFPTCEPVRIVNRHKKCLPTKRGISLPLGVPMVSEDHEQRPSPSVNDCPARIVRQPKTLK